MHPRTPPSTPPLRSARGFGVLELLAAISVLGVLAYIAIPRIAGSELSLHQAHAQLATDLRTTRARALVTGDHFQLEMTGASRYVTHRLTLVDDAWTASGDATIDRVLPPGIVFSRGASSRFEFDTRGMLVDPAAAGPLQIVDTRNGITRQITVWPSGQVQP